MVVMAGDHRTVDSLAMRIRAARVQAGEVEPGGIDVGEQTVGVGDEIVTLRNDRRLLTSTGHWVRNGDRWLVDQRDHHGELQVVSLDGRGRLDLPVGYAADHVALSYAVTLAKAQGVTVDHGIVLADETTSELGLYVGMTRGRHTNDALVVTDTGEAEHGRRPQPPSAREVLVRVLQRDSADRSATEVYLETISPDSYGRLSASLQDIVSIIDSPTGRRGVENGARPDQGVNEFDLRDRVVQGLHDQLARPGGTLAPRRRGRLGAGVPAPEPVEIDVGVDLP